MSKVTVSTSLAPYVASPSSGSVPMKDETAGGSSLPKSPTSSATTLFIES